MAGRIRSIKPEVLDDEIAAALSDEAWRLWVSMWVLADDYGNLRAGDKYLAAQVWQDTSRQVSASLRELRQVAFVRVYEVNGQTYAHINGWEKHQRVDNAGKPRVPGFEEGTDKPFQEVSDRFAESRGKAPRDSETVGALPLDQRPPTPISDRPTLFESDRVARFDFDALYARYPRKEGKADGMRHLKTRIKSQADHDRFAAAVDAYAAIVRREGRTAVLLWSTFCNGRWTDYEPGAPALQVSSPGGDESEVAAAKRRAEAQARFEAEARREAGL